MNSALGRNGGSSPMFTRRQAITLKAERSPAGSLTPHRFRLDIAKITIKLHDNDYHQTNTKRTCHKDSETSAWNHRIKHRQDDDAIRRAERGDARGKSSAATQGRPKANA
ncbi:hypothetical protein K523DRAFT_131601 [Schizophyllum commune Tattone D]|nr:hypothetical protein K523DRAFT_131601 [Schizophyllum commune Tattone D]